MSGDTQGVPGLGPSSTPSTTPVYIDQTVVGTQSDSLSPPLSAPTAVRGRDMRTSDRRPQSILISRTPSPLLITPPPLPSFERDSLSKDPPVHASRSSSSSSISSVTFTSSSSSSSSRNAVDPSDSPSSSLRDSSPPSPSQGGKDSPRRQPSPVLSASPSITFAPLPNIEPRTRKSNRGPLGVAARGAILRERRQQMLLAQGHGHLDGIDGVADASAGQAVDSCAGGNNAGRPQARDPLADDDDALIAIGKMFNDAGRMLWKRMSIRKGKSKSKGKHESFDVATIRAEDDLTSPIEECSTTVLGSTLYDEASTDFVALSQDDALSEADLQALIDMGTTPDAPAIVVVT